MPEHLVCTCAVSPKFNTHRKGQHRRTLDHNTMLTSVFLLRLQWWVKVTWSYNMCLISLEFHCTFYLKPMAIRYHQEPQALFSSRHLPGTGDAYRAIDCRDRGREDPILQRLLHRSSRNSGRRVKEKKTQTKVLSCGRMSCQWPTLCTQPLAPDTYSSQETGTSTISDFLMWSVQFLPNWFPW